MQHQGEARGEKGGKKGKLQQRNKGTRHSAAGKEVDVQ